MQLLCILFSHPEPIVRVLTMQAAMQDPPPLNCSVRPSNCPRAASHLRLQQLLIDSWKDAEVDLTSQQQRAGG